MLIKSNNNKPNIVLVSDTDCLDLSKVSDKIHKINYNIINFSNLNESLLYINSTKNHDINLVILYSYYYNKDHIVWLSDIVKSNNVSVLIISEKEFKYDYIVSYIKAGASDYIDMQNSSSDTLVQMIQKYITRKFCIGEILDPISSNMIKDLKLEHIITNSNTMNSVMLKAKKIIKNKNIPIFISGEIGTGKKEIAKAIHKDTLDRGNYPFIICNKLNKKYIHKALFGEDISASKNKIFGKILEANGGTLYIDEISNIPLDVQEEIVSFMNEGVINNVLGEFKVDIRIIFSSNEDIVVLLQKNLLHKKLFFKLSDFCLSIPNLVDRKEDIISLAEYYIDVAAKFNNKSSFIITQPCKDFLLKYTWPGNVMELKNAMYSAVLLSDNNMICLEDIESIIMKTSEISSINKLKHFNLLQNDFNTKSLADMEKEIISDVYNYYNHDIESTAIHLGVSSQFLQDMLRDN